MFTNVTKFEVVVMTGLTDVDEFKICIQSSGHSSVGIVSAEVP